MEGTILGRPFSRVALLSLMNFVNDIHRWNVIYCTQSCTEAFEQCIVHCCIVHCWQKL